MGRVGDGWHSLPILGQLDPYSDTVFDHGDASPLETAVGRLEKAADDDARMPRDGGSPAEATGVLARRAQPETVLVRGSDWLCRWIREPDVNQLESHLMINWA